MRSTGFLSIQSENSIASDTSILQDIEIVSCSSQQHATINLSPDTFVATQENNYNKGQCPTCGTFYTYH